MAMKSILERSFRYVPSTQTDLRKTFARIRRERQLKGPRPGFIVVPIKQKP